MSHNSAVWKATPARQGTALHQASFDELGTPLYEAEFVVVDLETTGGPPGAHAITEIGAVKVRGGEVLGEFSTLVNPGVPLPPMITVLTGITTAMTLQAPRIEEVLPSFLQWAGFDRDAILVAHNARFDAGFLKAACADLDFTWPAPLILDTLALARRTVTRDEVSNYKLGTLAAAFRTSTTPTHRALDDARATVELLHIFLERLGPLGVTHVEDLKSATDPVPPSRRRKSSIAHNIPHGPGVYQFHGPGGEILYVGTATDLRTRVKSYFTRAEKRRRIGEMVDIATSVTPIPCETVIEARVREVRLIDSLQPPYNRRSRRARQLPWVRMTEEPHPRLSIARHISLTDVVQAWGPYSSAPQARLAAETLATAFGLRTCTKRLPREPDPEAHACPLAELGRCEAPCVSRKPHGSEGTSVGRAREALNGNLGALHSLLHEKMAQLSEQHRFEDAAHIRDALRAVTEGAQRAERYRMLSLRQEVIAARPGDTEWEIVVIRWGRLAAAGKLYDGRDPWSTVELLRTSAEDVPPPVAVSDAATPEETALLLDWILHPHTRLLKITGDVPFAFDIDGPHTIPLPPTPEKVPHDRDAA